MKKIILVFLGVLSMLVMVGCNTSNAFKVGKDEGSYVTESTFGDILERLVYVQITGPEGEELFNGKITVKSVDPTANEALRGACDSKGISLQMGESDGWIVSIGDFVGGLVGDKEFYWMGYLNDAAFTNAAGFMQVREKDYLQFKFVEYIAS